MLGVEPRNLRVAAGLGRVDLIAELAGTPAAGAHRGFYRPHGGFPAWRPSEDPQEVLDEALVWAAKSDRVEALPAARRAGRPHRRRSVSWHGADVGRGERSHGVRAPADRARRRPERAGDVRRPGSRCRRDRSSSRGARGSPSHCRRYCSSSAPTRRSATRCTTAPLPAGPPSAGTAGWRRCSADPARGRTGRPVELSSPACASSSIRCRRSPRYPAAPR